METQATHKRLVAPGAADAQWCFVALQGCCAPWIGSDTPAFIAADAPSDCKAAVSAGVYAKGGPSTVDKRITLASLTARSDRPNSG